MKSDKEWYVVEQLCCDDERLCGVSNGVASLGINRIAALKLECLDNSHSKNAVTFKDNQGKHISFTQYAFSDFGAAFLYFKTRKKQIINTNSSDQHFERILIRRVLAESIDDALSLPPSDTHGRECLTLADFPKWTWFNCTTSQSLTYEISIATTATTRAELDELIQKSKPHDLLYRLVTGFTPLGFSLVASDGCMTFEFRHLNSNLRLFVRGAEGGVSLIWTDLQDFDFSEINKRYFYKNIPDGVEYDSFSDRDAFWERVNNLTSPQ